MHDGYVEVDTAKKLLDVVSKKFIEFNKNEKYHFLDLLTSIMYNEVNGVREHILKLSSFYKKLKDMEINLGETFLTYIILKKLSISI